MRLPGRLGLTTLGDVLGALHRGACSGVLALREESGVSAGAEHEILLSRGLVARVSTPLELTPVGELLEREGVLPSGTAERLVRALRPGHGRRLGELLVRARVLEQARLREVLRRQSLRRLDALYGLRDARLGFHVAGRPASGTGIVGAAALLAPREFLHGRRRLRDLTVAGSPREAGRAVAVDAGERESALRALGLDRDARAADIRRAFRRMAASAHPDLASARGAPSDGREAARFAQLSAAYHTLIA